MRLSALLFCLEVSIGEPEAVNAVIQAYTGYIKYLSYFQGSINNDIQNYLKAPLMEVPPNFALTDDK